MGLGLSIVKTIIANHGGIIRAFNNKEHGAKFIIRLPTTGIAMAHKPIILCVDDQREVLSAVLRDLEQFSEKFDLIDCERSAEAWSELERADTTQTQVALIICDHMMPEESGVQFLERVHKDHRFLRIRKILLTGMATQSDTIEAINRARIDGYIAKPWQRDELVEKTQIELTRFILAAGLPYQEFGDILNQDILMKELWQSGS